MDSHEVYLTNSIAHSRFTYLFDKQGVYENSMDDIILIKLRHICILIAFFFVNLDSNILDDVKKKIRLEYRMYSRRRNKG